MILTFDSPIWLAAAAYAAVGLIIALVVFYKADPARWRTVPSTSSGNFIIGAWLVAAVALWPVLIVLTMLTGLGWLARKVVGG